MSRVTQGEEIAHKRMKGSSMYRESRIVWTVCRFDMLGEITGEGLEKSSFIGYAKRFTF